MTHEPERITIGGRTGWAVYLDDGWVPTIPPAATWVKIVFDDGGRAFYHIAS